MLNKDIKPDHGSFRDPSSRVYKLNNGERIIRGLNEEALNNFRKLSNENFYKDFVENGHVIKSKEISLELKDSTITKWNGYIEHEKIKLISYPYEWTFSMLKDAALLHLKLLEISLNNGWIIKDSSPYNIQFIGSKPIFIDTPSFKPWDKGEPWSAYRQFTSNFLIPLMLKAYLDINYLNLIRSSLDGIPPTEAIKFFSVKKYFKRGVLSHIFLPSRVEKNILKKERNNAPAKNRNQNFHSKTMVIALVNSMTRLIQSLNLKKINTDWSEYENTHSYKELDFISKKEFIQKNISNKNYIQTIDIGCNSGEFSEILSKFSRQTISIDNDSGAIEKLYKRTSMNVDSNITPLIIDIANASPSQGFFGSERKSFDQRIKPDLILCLALIHHTRITSNIPNEIFISYLKSNNCDVIIEWVDREDEMVKKLMKNKSECYEDYNLNAFTEEIGNHFIIKDSMTLKKGKRKLFYITPKA